MNYGAFFYSIRVDCDFYCSCGGTELTLLLDNFFDKLEGGLANRACSLLKFIVSRISNYLSSSLDLIRLSAYSSESKIALFYLRASYMLGWTGFAI